MTAAMTPAEAAAYVKRCSYKDCPHDAATRCVWSPGGHFSHATTFCDDHTAASDADERYPLGRVR